MLMRSPRRVVIVLVAGVIGYVSCTSDSAPTGPTRDLTVRVIVARDRSICSDPAGTDYEGSQFSVLNSEGNEIADGTLGRGTPDSLPLERVRVCSFYGSVRVTDSSRYSVNIGSSEVRFSRADLEAAEWTAVIPEERLGGP